jgi:hypothetical protein
MSQSIDLAIPSFFMEEDNQIYVLLIFFLNIILIPMAIIAKT